MKNQKINLVALVCGVLSLAFTASAHADTVLNGDFTEDASSYTGFAGILGQNGNPDFIPEYTGDGSGALNGPGTGSNFFGPGTSQVAATATENYGVVFDAESLKHTFTFAANSAYTATVEVAFSDTGYAAGTPYVVVDNGTSVVIAAPTTNTTNLVTAPVTALAFTLETFTFDTTTGGAGYITLGNDPIGTSGTDLTDYTDLTLSHVALGGGVGVPEPSSFALMFLGLGGLYFIIRLRNVSRKS